MEFIKPMEGTLDEGTEVGDVGMHMREKGMCFPCAYGNGLMMEAMSCKRGIRRISVATNSAAGNNDIVCKGGDRCLVDVFHDTHLGKSHVLPVILPREEGDGDENRRLIGATSSFWLCGSTKEHVIHLDGAVQTILTVTLGHGFADAMEHRPRGVVVDADLLGELKRGETALVECDAEEGEEPCS